MAVEASAAQDTLLPSPRDTGGPRQVVVVGAGPVGLSLALGLARRGIDVLVLEKNAATAEHSRAPAIWPRTQEVLAALGVVETLRARGILVPRLELQDADRGGFLLSADFSELAGQTPYPQLLILPQSRTEKLLLHAVRQQASAEVRFSCEVTGLIHHHEKVAVRFRAGGEEQSVEARFVAGCDGAHSAVREAIRAKLEGITYDFRAGLADVRMPGSASLHSPRLTTRPRLAIGIRMEDDLWRMILPFSDRSGVPLAQQAEQAARGLFQRSDFEPVWQSDFQLHRRLATTFTQHRVVLAGDAAHLNSPVGGQGMNAGIQDTEPLVRAMLSALEQNDSGPLVQFGTERRDAVMQGVNRFTDRLTRTLMTGGGRGIKPMLRLAGAALHFPPARHRMLRRLAMLD